MSESLRVDVVMGGPGREAAVSRISGAAIVAAFEAGGHDVLAVDCDGELALDALRPDSVVFNIIHGTYGEDGRLQVQLDAAGRTYIGADAPCSALCMDKEATKARWREHELPVPWGKSINPRGVDQEVLKVPHAGPWVLKPRCDGSSVGLQFLASTSFLLPALERSVAEIGPVPLLLEERLPGPEYTVGIIDDGSGGQRVLPPLQIVPAEGAYDYEAKYQRDDTDYLFVEDVALATELRELAAKAYSICGCRDLGRIDFIAGADGRPRLIEINTLPGFTDHSLLPKAAARDGLPFGELVAHLVRCAQRRAQSEENVNG